MHAVLLFSREFIEVQCSPFKSNLEIHEKYLTKIWIAEIHINYCIETLQSLLVEHSATHEALELFCTHIYSVYV